MLSSFKEVCVLPLGFGTATGGCFGPDDPRFLEKALVEVVKGRVSFPRQQSSSFDQALRRHLLPSRLHPAYT